MILSTSLMTPPDPITCTQHLNICVWQWWTIENVFRSKYLRTIFTTDVQQKHDVKRQGEDREGPTKMWTALSHSWLTGSATFYQVEVIPSKQLAVWLLHPDLWLWNLTATPDLIKMINGANSSMLARFTGKTIPQEARNTSFSFHIIRQIRIRSGGLNGWGTLSERSAPSHLIYQAVVEQHSMGLPVNILMDAPALLMFIGSDNAD